ncbi:jeltraxin-like [Anomaloglossus baeobatrachus]|uniref:jeltraxin-like n=1 Tax=Anomaloglossus baeobatrachus TaxID=238106 RepID=UPI003F506DA0
MKFLFIFLCLFIGSCHVQEATAKTIMLFPKTSYTDYVTLHAAGKALHQVTVCMRSYTELTREHSLFSLAMHRKDNALLIYPYPPNKICISINNEDIYFRVDPDVLDWKHTCVTWNAATGLLQLWINGKRYPRRVTTNRSLIGPVMSVVLGQEQDSFGGGFSSGQSFVGELSDVNMWNYVLSPKAIRAYLSNKSSLCGNIYNWASGTYTAKGDVSILKHQYFPL